MNILVIDNTWSRDSWGAWELANHCAQASRGTVHVRRAPAQDLPKDPSAFQAVVLSGSITATHDQSPWVKALDAWVKRYLELKRPFLGVCYGHQTLARVLGGLECVSDQTTAEFGWTEVQVLEDSPLLRGLGQKFTSFSWHKDEVCKQPPGTKILAKSQGCSIQAMQLKELPIFGIQFHPEKSLHTAVTSLQKRVKEKKWDGILHPNDSDRLYDPNVGKTLFENFFGLVK